MTSVEDLGKNDIVFAGTVKIEHDQWWEKEREQQLEQCVSHASDP